LLRYFVEVSHRSEELLELIIQDFYDVINDERLNVKSEETVWNCCIKWIDKDPVERAQHVTKLMRAVRLGLLNTAVSGLLKTYWFPDKVIIVCVSVLHGTGEGSQVCGRAGRYSSNSH
jgi:hypothetical protein